MREVFLLLGLGLVICATAQSLPPSPSSDKPPTLIDQNESKKCGKSTPSVPSNRARRADIGQFGGQKTAELIEKQKVLAEETPADEPKKEAAKPAATKEDKSKPRSKREDKKPAVSNPFPTGGIPVGEPNKDFQGSKAATKDDKSKTRSKRNDNKIAPSSNQGVFGQQSGLQTSQISQQPIGQSSGLQIPAAIPGQGQLPAGQIPPQSQLPGQVPNQFPSHFSNQIPIESQVPQLPGLVPGGQLPTHISPSGQQSQVHLNNDEPSQTRPKRQLEPKPILPQAPNEPAPKLPPAPDSESNEEPSDPINPVGKRQKRQSFASQQEFEAEQDSSLHHHSSSSSSEQVEVGNQGGPVHEQPGEQRVKRQEPDQELDAQSNSQDEDSNDSAQNRARRYANNKNANANQSIEDNTEDDNEDEDDEQDTVENEDDNNWQTELVKDARDNDSDENEPDDELSPAHDESESNSDEELLNAHNGVLKEHTKPPGL